MSRITIYDTTLRDGMQGLEINYSLSDKLAIAHKLDDMQVDFIEGGFPLSNQKEADFFRKAKSEHFSHAKLVAFGSTRRPGGKAADDPHIKALVDAETPAVIVVGKTWKAHIEHVLATSIEENLAMIHDSISYLKSEGRIVFFDLEHFFDGYKDDPAYALSVLKTGTQAGAEALVLCDTNGGVLPSEVIRILQKLPLGELAPIGVHFHNDTGTAVANSILSLDYGAVHIQGTMNGWGERCGNANLCSIIPNIVLKTDHTCNAATQLHTLTSVSRFVAEKANMIPDKRQPYVGIAAFSHKAGQHADVILKASHLMEHTNADLVGNERQILLSELAGKSTLVEKLKKYGTFDKKSNLVSTLIARLKQLENAGYEYEAAEASFDLVVRRALGTFRDLFELNNHHLESFKTGETPAKTVGRMFLRIQGKDVMGAAVGVGPVETLDAALRDALVPHFPFIKSIALTDYRVRVLNPEDASVAAKVRVFISSTDSKNSWDTVGVSENIIEASWEALVDSFNYYYNNFVLAE